MSFWNSKRRFVDRNISALAPPIFVIDLVFGDIQLLLALGGKSCEMQAL